ncbi:DNA primase/helicase, phage-associated [Aerosticca soli]|uniref:DNA primase/helicase, phage-associated n=1 Tax=Aerosticca soli TaxID=2010829 RepID=A0A2Z6E8N0_9GAMM|nr:DNA primase/helicase, phage-associated [Aerosticca soli]
MTRARARDPGVRAPRGPARRAAREAGSGAVLAVPAGRTRRGKFVIGDVLGSPGDSLEVVLDGDKAGLWTDRATGDGGDVFHLIGAHFGVDVQGDFARILDLAEDLVGRAPTAPSRAEVSPHVIMASITARFGGSCGCASSAGGTASPWLARNWCSVSSGGSACSTST